MERKRSAEVTGECRSAKVDRDWTYVYAYVFVPLYERQVAKPLSICNPDRDAFASRFTDGIRSSVREKERREEKKVLLSLSDKDERNNKRERERERENAGKGKRDENGSPRYSDSKEQ